MFHLISLTYLTILTVVSSWEIPVHSISLSLKIIFPSGSINIRDQDLKTCSFAPYIAIVTAGIWHNLLLSFGAMALITRPMLWLWGYYTPNEFLNGLLVVSVNPTSPLHDLIPEFCRIQTINGQPMTSLNDFAQLQSPMIPPVRQCLRVDPTILPCCDINSTHPIHPSGEMCFYHVNGTACTAFDSRLQQCARDSDCLVGQCMTSFLPNPRFRLLNINFNRSKRSWGWHGIAYTPIHENVVWLGDPQELQSLHFGRVYPLPYWVAWCPEWWPYFAMSILEFTISTSFSIAIVNILPFPGFDGFHAFQIWTKRRECTPND
jgi:hypothetical protein